jgi:iron complex outermembrane receptor protein
MAGCTLAPRRLVLTAMSVILFAPLGSAQEPDRGASPRRLKRLSIEQLTNLEVTSVSRRPESLSRAASAIQVITNEDIRRAGATRLPEALRLASNLEVAQIDSRQWAISARGFNNATANKLLVLIDGRTVYTPLYAGVFWDVQDVPLWDVERIEVISGPGATLWGANAVNGVINIITKSGGDTPGLYTTGGVGTRLRGFGGARWGGRFGSTLRYRLYARGFARAESDSASGAPAGDEWHMGQGGFRADWNPSNRNQLTVQGDLYDGRVSQPTAADIVLRGHNLVSQWSHSFSATSDLRLHFYHDFTHRDLPNVFIEDLDTYDFDFQYHALLGRRHNVVGGIGARFIDDDVVNSATLAFLPADVERKWFTGFVQDEIMLVPRRVHFIAGTKIEHNDYTGFEVQPSVRVSWTPRGRGTLWSALSRAVRTPSRIDREIFAPGQPPYTIVQGGPDFASEHLVAYELGYRLQARSRLAFSVSTFYNWYDDLRSTQQINPPAIRPVVIANGFTATSYGAELTAEYQLSEGWRVRAGYTEKRLRVKPKPGSTDTTQGVGEAADPNRHLLLRSSWDLPGHLTVDATSRYVSEIVLRDVPAYGELDLRLGWHPTSQLELSVAGQNLLHAHHTEFGVVGTRRDGRRGLYGQLEWHF